MIGRGAVGLRAAKLLQTRAARSPSSGIPADRFGDEPYRRPRGLDTAEERGIDAREPKDATSSRRRSTARRSSSPPDRPASRCCPSDLEASTRRIEVLADFNAAEPLGIEGTKATDDLEDYDGKRVLGALAIGGPKMKVHKTCMRRLFETNDEILDIDGVYEIAKELV